MIFSHFLDLLGHYLNSNIKLCRTLPMSIHFFINSLGDHFADLQNGGVFRDFEHEGVFLGVVNRCMKIWFVSTLRP